MTRGMAWRLLATTGSWLSAPIEGQRGRGPGGIGPEGSDMPAPWLGHLLLISLLVMLNLPLFFTTITGTDQYGFFTLGPLAAYPLPLALSTVLSTALAVAGYACYRWLWRRQWWFTERRWSPLTRGAMLSAVPVLLAYAPSVVLTSHGWKPTLLALGALVAGALCVTHALRDSEMDLDSVQARYWFICGLGSILVFLVLCIGGMIVLYRIEQFPASGNMLWAWEYRFSELGYPREEYHSRQRDALLGFTLTGTGFMIAALRGSMLGSILRWTRSVEGGGIARRTPATRQQYPDAPPWVARIARQIESLSPSTGNEAEYVAVFNGYEIEITAGQYQRLVGAKFDMLHDVDLLVDKAAGNVFLRTDGTWAKLDFRVRGKASAIRSGPFSLLCIYARSPGKRFANGELRTLLDRELDNHAEINVRDFVFQLLRRTPRLPVGRDATGSFLDETANVCFLDLQRSPTDNGGAQTNGPQLL